MRNIGLPDGLDRAMTMRDFIRMATMSAGLVGSPIPQSQSLPAAAIPDGQGQGASVVPVADAPVYFNLDACMKMGEG